MNWRLAQSLSVLKHEVNKRWPHRPTDADGTIGDRAHQSRRSDHNPNDRGIVQAWDITAPVGHEVVERLRRSRDPRVKYAISQGRMYSSYPKGDTPPWTWRPYSGSNPHTHHAHLSVVDDPALYDDPSPWGISEPEEDIMRSGDRGPEVSWLQARLTELGHADLQPFDGVFGPKTEAALKSFQRFALLPDDGVYDVRTDGVEMAVHLAKKRIGSGQAPSRVPDHSHTITVTLDDVDD